MQKIEKSTIKLNRGDVLNLSLTIKQEDGTDYTFQYGDVIVFSIYNSFKLNDKAVLLKEIQPTIGTKVANINLTSEETRIGNLTNAPVEYWYEIELNNQYTIVGYDEDGAKKLILYPEGSKVI